MTDPGDEREPDVILAFVDLSAELVDDYDILELLGRLTTNCVLLLDIASAGLLVADGSGALHLAAASSERTRQLEVFQLQRNEGPCLDAYRDGTAVIAPDLSAEQSRWPLFSRAALDAGFKSVHAVPMHLRGHGIGGLGLFGTQTGVLQDRDLNLAQALAHVAAVAIVNEKNAADHATIKSQLQQALTSRITLEQAKGVIAHSLDLEIDEAFEVLRRYARDHGHKLSAIATAVVNRELRPETLVRHDLTRSDTAD